MKYISSLLLFVFAWSWIAIAQAPAVPAPVAAVVNQAIAPAIDAAPVVVQASGIMGWINAHGGFQAAVLLLVGAFMSIMSGVRQLLAALDGVAPGAAIPDNMAGLSAVNKICVILGKVVDFLTGNVAH